MEVKMKVALVVFALIGLGLSAPQPRKIFHEHFEEFMDIIITDVGDRVDQLLASYSEYEEFAISLNYISTKNFKDLVYEMESLPEFLAVVDFLEKDNIDIHFFIDMFNDIIENAPPTRRARIATSGTDFTSFIDDIISLFAKDKLSALYDRKMAEDEEFKNTMQKLKSDEWDTVFKALWDSVAFQAEVQTLADHGINIHTLLHEIVAIFGQ